MPVRSTEPGWKSLNGNLCVPWCRHAQLGFRNNINLGVNSSELLKGIFISEWWRELLQMSQHRYLVDAVCNRAISQERTLDEFGAWHLVGNKSSLGLGSWEMKTALWKFLMAEAIFGLWEIWIGEQQSLISDLSLAKLNLKPVLF